MSDNGCKHCHGRGYIVVREPYDDRKQSAGPWLQYACAVCGGRRDERDDRTWYHGAPKGFHDALAWLKDAVPPENPFRMYKHAMVYEPKAYFDELRGRDHRFFSDEIMRLYELFGNQEDFL